MDIPNHAELLDRVETFCRRHDMAETRFGREAVSNPNFITGLRKVPPVSPTLDTLGKVRDFMARIDAEAVTRAKLDAPLDSSPPEQEEIELPFRSAPVTNATGASSLTSSPMNGHPSQRVANPRSPLSCDPDHGTAGPLPPFEAGQTRAEGRTPGAPPVLSDREA